MAEQPTIEVGGRLYLVLDVSERGLRYEMIDEALPEVGSRIEGVVEFHGSDAVDIAGEVIRSRARLVVLALDGSGIPYSNVLFEQRHLRSKGFRLLD